MGFYCKYCGTALAADETVCRCCGKSGTRIEGDSFHGAGYAFFKKCALITLAALSVAVGTAALAAAIFFICRMALTGKVADVPPLGLGFLTFLSLTLFAVCVCLSAFAIKNYLKSFKK